MNAKADDKTLEAAMRRAGAPQTPATPGSIFSVQWSSPRSQARSKEVSGENGGEKASAEKRELLPAGQPRSDDVPAAATEGSGGMSLASLRGSPLTSHPFRTPGASAARRGSDESLLTKSSARSSTYSVSPRPTTWLGEVVTSNWFSRTAVWLVLLNMAIMCMPYQGMSPSYATRLEVAANSISILFMLEMSLKLYGLGCNGYWSDKWNALDGTIVLISAMEMILEIVASSSGIKLSFLRMLRLLRVLRVLRLMRSWHGLYRVISCFVQALPQLFNMFVLMSLTMLIFSLMGMQVGPAIQSSPLSSSPLTLTSRPHLLTLPHSFLSLFALGGTSRSLALTLSLSSSEAHTIRLSATPASRAPPASAPMWRWSRSPASTSITLGPRASAGARAQVSVGMAAC